MILNFHTLRRSIILIQKTGIIMPVGMVVDVVVQSEKGIVQALWTKTKEGLRVVRRSDIREWKKDKTLFVENEQVFQDPEKVSDLQKVFATEVPIVGAKVWNRNQYKGRVHDFSFDIYTGFIMTLSVKQGWWIWKRKKQIHRSKIVKINKNGIFVSESTIQKLSDREENQEILTSIKTNKNI